MKRVLSILIVTMCVSGIFSSVNAAFTIEPEKTDVGMGEEITIGLYSSSGQEDMLYLIVEWGHNSILKDPIAYPPLGDLGSITPYTEIGFTDSGYVIIIQDLAPLSGGLVADFTFVTMDVGDITVSLYDQYSPNPIDSVIIHESPEPTTLALLGLGALALRKRRR